MYKGDLFLEKNLKVEIFALLWNCDGGGEWCLITDLQGPYLGEKRKIKPEEIEGIQNKPACQRKP